MGCLVNHSYDRGVFVLQVPIPIKVADLDKALDTRDKSAVLAVIDKSLGIQASDIE